jgi:hypothetical protein
LTLAIFDFNHPGFAGLESGFLSNSRGFSPSRTAGVFGGIAVDLLFNPDRARDIVGEGVVER